MIPVATVTGADLSRGFLNTTLKLALVSGETVKLSWTKAGNDDDMVKAWLRRALGPKLLDQGVAT